jgi:hypothetical protein
MVPVGETVYQNLTVLRMVSKHVNIFPMLTDLAAIILNSNSREAVKPKTSATLSPRLLPTPP